MPRDCHNRTIRPGLAGFTALVLASAALTCATFSKAAEPDFVGVLALAVEDEVARQIKLSEGARAKLLEVIDRRENEALELVLEIRDLPPTQRAAALAPFRAESERQGLALLTDQQRRELRAIQVSRMGMASLGEPDVSQQLGLSPVQQKQIDQLLEQRAEATANVDRKKQRLAQETYERKLAAVLSGDQRARWEHLAAATSQEQEASEEEGLRQPAVSAVGPHSAAGGGWATPSPEPSQQVPKPGDRRLQFSFRYAPWRAVLEWFALQADLSLVTDAQPPGTFNYIDRREYSPSEAIDLLNSVLLTKGYTLVRRDRMLMLINLEDGIPPNLVSQLLPDELDDRGESELVTCLFALERMTPEDAQREVSSLLGPQGSIVVLPASRQILVTETAGKLRVIRKVFEAVEDRDARQMGKTTVIPLQHANAEEVLVIARQLLGLPEGQNEAPDGTLRMAAGLFGSRLVATGEPHMVSRLSDLVEVLDVPPGVGGISGAVIETPQLEVYSIATADPTSVLQVLQTLLAGMPDVRLSMDPKTGNLVALARPSQHGTIRATIDQMQRDARQIEVIRLWSVDPQLAVTSINKLFGGEGAEGNVDPSAPRVDADPTTRSLLIRGSQAQIAQIRTLLAKMGEGDAEARRIGAGQRGNVRMVPITGPGARRALEQAALIWPTMRPNRVRSITPSAAVRTIRPGRDMTAPLRPSIHWFPNETPTGETENNDTDAGNGRSLKEGSDADLPAAREATSLPLTTTSSTASFGWQEHAVPADGETADILVAPGPRGVVIASEDTEALDDFEGLLLALGDGAVAGQRELAVFYLKYAKAEVAAELLKPFLGAGGSDEGAGGGSLLGDLAGAALGDAGGGLIGSLLELGGGGGISLSSSGTINVMADSRLNALVIQASPEKLDLAERLLEVIDQISSPEDVQTFAKPRFIPVVNMTAEGAAAIVRDIYAARIRAPGGQPRQPTPEEFFRALRGGRGQRSSTRRAVEEQEQMTISVDSRSNSLIVSAPDPLFRDVQELVSRLDELASEHRTATRVVTLRGVNPETVQQALTTMLGDAVRSGADRDGPGRSRQADRPAAPGPRPPTPEQTRERMRRGIEFFNALQRAGQAGQGRPAGRGR